MSPATRLALVLTLAVGCESTVDPPPTLDAGITAEPPHEPPPAACLPWPCPDAHPLND